MWASEINKGSRQHDTKSFNDTRKTDFNFCCSVSFDCESSLLVWSRSCVVLGNQGELNSPKQGDQHVFVRV